MRGLAIFLSAAALSWTAPLGAQTRITAEQFLDLATGKTLHFHNLYSGELVGVEQFLRHDLSVWKDTQGRCVYGRISIEEGQLCFHYEDETYEQRSCWYTFKTDDTLTVRTPGLFGASNQIVRAITDDPVGCPSAPNS